MEEEAAPLLRPSRPAAGPTRPGRLAVLLGRASGRRGSSMVVRETAARQLEERRLDWGYSRPIVALDVLWNLGFAVSAAVVLAATLDERPNTPLRIWAAGYAAQCLVHVTLVLAEYRRRNNDEGSEANDSEEDDDEAGGSRGHHSNIAKRCESLNTLASFIWWIVGFYWVVSGGDTLIQNAPRLYWLSVVFLAFDVFFAIFCVALACVIGIALCCFLPCIIAILYALAGQEGASDADISVLPRYRYAEHGEGEKTDVGVGLMVPIVNNGGNSMSERALSHEDAECCICLSSYEDGAELHALPCDHHFHSTCIVKWLRIHATCPLCKFNIIKGNEVV